MLPPAGAEEGLAREAGGAAEEGGRGLVVSFPVVLVSFVVFVVVFVVSFFFFAVAVAVAVIGFVAAVVRAPHGRRPRRRRLAHQPPGRQENGVPGPQLRPHDALERLDEGHGAPRRAAGPGREGGGVGGRERRGKDDPGDVFGSLASSSFSSSSSSSEGKAPARRPRGGKLPVAEASGGVHGQPRARGGNPLDQGRGLRGGLEPEELGDEIGRGDGRGRTGRRRESGGRASAVAVAVAVAAEPHLSDEKAALGLREIPLEEK